MHDDDGTGKNRPDWDVTRGIESRQTFSIHGKIKLIRRYVRHHGVTEGLFRDFSEALDFHASVVIARDVVDEFKKTLASYELSMFPVWCGPSLSLLILDHESQQFLSWRGMRLNLNEVDLPTSRMLTQAGVLLTNFGAAGQPPDFEQNIEVIASETLLKAPDE